MREKDIVSMKRGMECTLREMTIDDYDDVRRLWEQTEGLNLEEADTREGIAIYLNRNRRLCFVACVGSKVVGTVLCGHDGRRGIPPSLSGEERIPPKRNCASSNQRVNFNPRKRRDYEM